MRFVGPGLNLEAYDATAGSLRTVLPDEKRQPRLTRQVTELEAVRVGPGSLFPFCGKEGWPQEELHTAFEKTDCRNAPLVQGTAKR